MEFGQQGMMGRQEEADAKTILWQFCQRFCKGPVAKTDIQFNSAKVHPNGMQATVKLLCLQGQEFAGEICSNAKEAEKSAALQALQFYGMEAPRPQAPPQMGGMSGMAAQQLLAMSGGMPGGVPGGMPGGGGRSGNAQMQGGPGMFNPAAFQMMGGSGAPMGVPGSFGGPSHGNFAMGGGMGGGMGMQSQAPSRPRPDNKGGGAPMGGKGGGGKSKGGDRGGGGKGDRTRPQGGKDGGRGQGGKDGGGRGGGGRGAGGPAAKGAPPAPAKTPAQDGAEKNDDGDVDTSKSTLNVVCMKLLKRPMQKGEIVYDSPQTPGGFQSIVTLPCLPEPWGQKQWNGKVCANRKTAEQDAAEKALADIKAAPEFAAILESAEASGGKGAKKKSSGDRKGEDGKGKGKGKKGKMMEFFEMMWGKGGGMKGGPGLERQPVGEALVQGEVTEWKGNFGWIKPKDGTIEHEALGRRGGKVYVHKTDLQGVETLEQGASVKFKVYVDASGLGAADVVVG